MSISEIRLSIHNEDEKDFISEIPEASLTRLEDIIIRQPKMLRDEPLTSRLQIIIICGILLYWWVIWTKDAESSKLSQSSKSFIFWLRLFMFPIIGFLSSFFVTLTINCIFSFFLPSGWIKSNSKYYSHTTHLQLCNMFPLLTVQIPVYKESFETVILPTIESVLDAATNYKNNNGKLNILISDDGLMLLSLDEQTKRINYYNSRPEILYIARPPQNRAGKFKKASNMNFSLRVLNRIKKTLPFSSRNIRVLQIIAKQEGFMVGGGCKDFEIGKYILLLDSDSRIDNDKLPSIILEMESDPSLGFVQMKTSSMKVINDYWENAIAHFTNNLYGLSLVYSCANGNTAPLVGHNAILRWISIKRSSWINEISKEIMYWAEDKVSEDFDMSIRMQSMGYNNRYIGYVDGFREGVSLSPIEEIIRLQKYAYGISETIFHPFKDWNTKGIFSSVFKKFILCKNISFHVKFGLISYLGSFYALASAPVISILNYFCYKYSSIWREGVVDTFQIVVSCILVFSILLPLSNIVVKAKLENFSILKTFIKQEIKYTLILTLFFSGIFIFILVAFINHMFVLNMSWSTTKKEAEQTSFLQEIYNTIKILYIGYIWCLIMIVILIVGWYFLDIKDWFSIIPIISSIFCHFSMPLLLNSKIFFSCCTKTIVEHTNAI